MANVLERFTNVKLNKKEYLVDISPIVSPSGDFSRIVKLNVILNSWLNILTTPKGTADHDPSYGCGIQKYLFKPATTSLLATIKKEIFKVLTTYDNRIKITKIDVKFTNDYKGLSISIYADYKGERGKLYFIATENSFIINEVSTSNIG